MKKSVIFILLFISSICLVKAQYRKTSKHHKHEFAVGAFAGIAALKHDMSEGKSKYSFSGGVGFNYTYFFKKNMGLLTGVEFTFYNAELDISELSDSHKAFDLDLQKDFDFHYTLRNYKEKQNAFYLNIPIMLHYQFTDGEKLKFYGDGGIKVGIPINGKYKNSGADLTTYGYFPHNDATIDDIPFRGFGEFITQKRENNLSYKLSFNLALELGIKWALPKATALYTSIYMDYGLNDIKESSPSNLPLVQYNQLSPEDHIFNGFSKSTLSSGNSFVKKINTLHYGLKVRYAFGR